MFGLVYRYEDRDGTGPFEGAFLVPEFEAAAERAGLHGHPSAALWRTIYRPNFAQLRELDFRAPRYGVPSLRNLVEWFPRPARRVLAEKGYSLLAFDVEPTAIFEGSDLREVIFDKSRAVTIPLALALQAERRRRQAGSGDLPDPQTLFAGFLRSLQLNT